MVQAHQPVPGILIFLGAIFFLPFVFVVFMATPTFTLRYCILIILTLLCGMCLLSAIGLATKKIILTNDTIATRSLIWRSDINLDNVRVLAYWVHDLRDSVVGCIDLEAEGRIMRLRFDSSNMDGLMFRLLDRCSQSYIIDCDHGRLLPPDAELPGAHIDLDQTMIRLQRLFRLDLAWRLGLLLIFPGVWIYILITQGSSPAFTALIPMMLVALPVVYRAFIVYKRNRQIESLIREHVPLG